MINCDLYTHTAVPRGMIFNVEICRRNFFFLFKIYHGTIGKVTCKHPKIVKSIVKQITFIPVHGPEREFRNEF